MNRTKNQCLGLSVFAAALLFAAMFHLVGPGLLGTHPPRPLPGGMAVEMTSYHNAIVPLLVFGLTGLLGFMLSPKISSKLGQTFSPLYAGASVAFGLVSISVGHLAQYAPGGAGFWGTIIALSAASFGVVFGVLAMIHRESRWWLCWGGLAVSVLGAVRFFDGT